MQDDLNQAADFIGKFNFIDKLSLIWEVSDLIFSKKLHYLFNKITNNKLEQRIF